jgi:protein-tyrosine-phosphatase
MAGFLVKKLFSDKYEAISAETKLSGPEEPVGNLVPLTQAVIDVMLEEGLDISTAKRKQVTEEMVNNSDIVIAILEDEDLPQYLVDSPKLIRWFVLDPKNKDLIETRRIKDEIKGLLAGLEI